MSDTLRPCNAHARFYPDEDAARPLSEFGKSSDSTDGLRPQCRRCANEGNREGRKRRKAQRLASNHETLRPGDVGGGEYSAPEYDREKKQEFSEDMGRLSDELRGMAADDERLAGFVSLMGEQERRWLNKRLARSVSIGVARDMLFARQFEQIASRIRWPARLEGYAARPRQTHPRRMATFAASDLHFGALLPDHENPVGFDFLRAGRRFARLAYELGEFKPQYRDVTSLNLGINGDVIEGLLGWNDADNAPLAEQMVAAGYFLREFIAYQAARWPAVRVFFEPGNHGRNKLKHPGRATSSKWDSYETALYQFVAAQVRHLPNVRSILPKAPAIVIPLFDHNALMLHGDTELPLKAPGSSGGRKAWNDSLNQANAPRSHEPGSPPMYGVPIHVLISGHFHDPDLFPLDRGWGVSQGALVPSNGHARTAGYASRCMFWLFESVPGVAVGDTRPLRVGPRDDVDAGLDAVIAPFQWEEVSGAEQLADEPEAA